MAGTILVFGESGQVAKALAGLRSGLTSELAFSGRDRCDLLRDDPTELIQSATPSAVINAAAYTAVDKAQSEPDAAMRLNRDAPEAMAKACAARGIPFVHISTDYVFGGDKPEPYVETDPVAPLGAYGRSKSEGESAVMDAGGRWTIFRTAWVVAPEGKNFVRTMRRLAEERELVRVVDDQHGRPTLASDIAEMCLRAASSSADGKPRLEGLYHLAGAGDAAWADVAERVFQSVERLTGRRPVLERITTADYPTPAKRPANSRLDTSKLEKAANWAPRPWQEAVDLCLG